MQSEFHRTFAAARFFRRIGLVPLPSMMDRKRPTLVEFKQYQTEPVPKVVYAPDEWQTTNLQFMTGARTSGATKIIVIDLDGEPAKDAWRRICQAHDHRPRGVWVAGTGSGSTHVYYRLPVGLERCPTRLLWGLFDPLGGPTQEGGWVKHSEVKLPGDGMLAVAPPSRHVKTGVEYRWVGKSNPAGFPLPAEAPQRLIDAPALRQPIKQSRAIGEGAPPAPARRRPSPDGKCGPDRDAVLAAIPPAENLRLAAAGGCGSPATRTRGASGWTATRSAARTSGRAPASTRRPA